ncbi:DeoR/GlpR family DNA-binding transcription regulator [Peptostreptococcus canis]|uniref:Lactose phosphotransferase system repressor n=1 Tax=Peptostreptococcus canis TaxID=1159213 RepID=A0ABR6TL68_9FIRM|nr:DeoR/GlpR family DNA-binding transcription regulator [Peptostreptococcus canis]MBC2576156.1 DeoR/GlpR transcriptional regulator [Peptostreptococcus canis]MBP1998311.1 DeoR/GlpR family transcriptional regulator of sugar metabolism [Peptostreptococcus canis]
MERRNKLLELITAEGKISVSDLALKTGVSQVTIRKDLDELSSKGLIAREHGFAVTLNNDDISNRLSHNYSTKMKIAKLAAESIDDGETIMIESGSTCALLAEELCKTKKNIRIITNSIFIANFLRGYKNANITILGGEFQPESQVNTGPITKLCVQQYMVDKLFVGVDGFEESYGFTGSNLIRTDTVKDMAKSAKHIYILTSSEKFADRGLVRQFSLEEIDSIYTDNSIERKVVDLLQNQDIQVNIAK